MSLLKTHAALELWRLRGRGKLGFVPTMGALHAGHLSLVARARSENARVLVSIFVNPTQFGPKEDFRRYPRSLTADLGLLRRYAPLAVYAPPVEEVYPKGFATRVLPGGWLSKRMDALWRPGHFEGVATVVARLFGLVRPDRAYFGLKDYQQQLVIKAMVRDLALPIEVVACPIVRETDGLALSSRNRYLDPLERRKAVVLSQALQASFQVAAQGQLDAARICGAGKRLLARVPGLRVQYFELADAHTLAPVRRLQAPAVLAAAVLLGKTRLIDNLVLTPKGSHA